MIVDIQYWYCGNNQQRVLGFVTDNGTITGNQTTGVYIGGAYIINPNSPLEGEIYDPSQPCKNVFGLLYSNANYEVRVISAYPYAEIIYLVPPVGCDVVIGSVNKTTSSGINGSLTINATGTGTLEYRLMSSSDAGAFGSLNNFTGLAPGDYTVFVRKQADPTCVVSQNVTILKTLIASIDKTDVTVNGLNDGSITITITYGNGSYKVTWPDATFVFLNGTLVQQAMKTGLLAGTYSVVVDDLVSLQSITLTITIFEPVIIIPLSNHFFVPQIQSLRFVQTDPIVFQQFDNVLLCNEKHYAIPNIGYSQKVKPNDTFNIQFQSNYETHEAKLYNENNAVVKTFLVEQKIKNLNQKFVYPITIKAHTAGKSRIYFSSPFLPIIIKAGDVIFITENLDGFNGSYSIVSSETDFVTSTQYLVINKNYAIVSPQTAATGTLVINIVPFDIYETTINFTLLPNGFYHSEIKAITGSNIKTFKSEPIEINTNQERTNLIQFTNTDSAYDINYTTGILHQVRVESRLFKRTPGGERQTLRNTNGKLVKLMAKPQRKFLFEFWHLPPYLHEKLAVAFDHDKIFVNGLEIQTTEAYKEPNYLVRYPLSNSNISIEQVEWFKDYNGDDILLTNNNMATKEIPCLDLLIVSSSTATINLDLENKAHRIFNVSGIINANKTFALLNDSFALRFTIVFELGALVNITFPNTFISSNAEWTAGKIWSNMDTGKFYAECIFNKTNWDVTIHGPSKT